MIENLAYYIITDHNHYNFADSIQHYKKHRNKNFFNLDLNKGTLFEIFLICSGRWL